MKRFLTIVLVLSLLLVPMAAFAQDVGEVTEPPGTEDPGTEDPGTEDPVTEEILATIPKKYTAENEGAYANATFNFTFEAQTENAPAIPEVSISFNHADGEPEIKHGEIVLSAFDSDDVLVGRYMYTVTEEVGTLAGVEYGTRTGTLVVDKEDGGIVKSYLIIGTLGNEDEKHDEFENTYIGWTLDVTKDVTGNLGDKNKDFTFLITFTLPEGKTIDTENTNIQFIVNGTTVSTPDEFTFDENGQATVEYTVKHGGTIEITNLPDGMGYSVKEKGEEDGKLDEYVVTYENAEGTMDQDQSVVVTNDKSADVPTGITLDNMPYIILMAVALVGLGAFALRKRAQN